MKLLGLSSSICNFWFAVNDSKKNVEENIVKLIEKCYGEKLEASKSEIKNWLRRKNQSDRDLIEKSSKEALEESFPGIVTVIKSFVEDIQKELS